MSKRINILGLSFFYHDSAACLVSDGKILAAAQEERFTRKKHDESFPKKSIDYCLKSQGLSISDLDYVVFYEKPLLKFERLLETYMAFAPRGFASFIKAMPVWLKRKLWIKEVIRKELKFEGKILFSEHHESHAASAFYPSPYKEAAFLTIDGVGEWATTSFGVGRGNQLRIMADLHFPHSLGMLYSAFTYYIGFKVNSGEYKVMGLAPYGEPKYKDLILQELLDLREDGSLRLNITYFNYAAGLTMTSDKFNKLFGGPPRKPETLLTQKEMDLAASIQAVTDEVVMRMARHIRKETGQKYLCLAGGVALNCVANGKLLRSRIFEDIWIQPAAGDAGGALGAALVAWHRYLNGARDVDGRSDSMRGSYLGPEYSDLEIEEFLTSQNIPFTKLSPTEITSKVAKILGAGNIVGWFQGRMEFGPRALGARSILADARVQDMQKRMNLKIKFREGFRPFAPSVLIDKISDYFEIDRPSPYMLLVADVKKERQIPMNPDQKNFFGLDKINVVRSDIPSVTHIDYSARIQSVDRQTNPLYYNLISDFDRDYGSAVIVNTSFNIRGEPIVCSPEDAYRCFMRTDIDYLVLGSFLLSKKDQPKLAYDGTWQKEFVLD